MARLGPKSGGGAGGDEPDRVPAGVYIVAMKSFKRAQNKAKTADYLRCRWVVCAGPCEGRQFWSNMSLNLTTEGTVNRWRILMEACQLEEEIELGSTSERNTDEGDANIREYFLNRPIKVTVKVEQNGTYTNHDLEMIHYVRSWTQEDKDAMNNWLDALEQQGQPGSGAGAGTRDDPDDPPVPGGRADDWSNPAADDYGSVGGGTKAGGFAGGGDDDIPF